MKYYSIIFIIAILLSLPFSSALSQWSTDPTQNTLVQYWAANPMIVSDGAGGCYLAFLYDGPDVCHIDRTGVNTFPGGYVRTGNFVDSPGWGDIALADDGCVLLAYLDADLAVTPPYMVLDLWVRVQKVDSTGVLLWDTNGLLVSAGEWEMWWPQIVPDGEGGAIVAYVIIEGLTYNTYYTVVQRIDAQGNLLWGAEGITNPDTNTYAKPVKLTAVGEGEFVLQYRHYDNLVFQRFNLAGEFLWAEPATFPSWGDWVYMVADDSGGVFVTERWNDNGINRIRGIRLNAVGESLWGDEGIIIRDGNITYNYGARIAKNSDGSMTVCWQEEAPAITRTQRITALGEQLWSLNGQPISAVNCIQLLPLNVASNENANIFIWRDIRDSIINIYSQRLDIEGSNQWNIDDVIISDREALQQDLGICSDMYGGAIICWEEGAYTDGVYVQQISFDGQLDYVTEVGPNPNRQNANSSFRLFPPYPNPFNSNSVLQFQLNIISDVKISVFNNLGQKISDYNTIDLNPGLYKYSFKDIINPTIGLAGGIYFIEYDFTGGQDCQAIILTK